MVANDATYNDGKNAPASPLEPLAIDVGEAAKLCGIGRATWYSLLAAGRIPKPVRLGRRALWRTEELRAWMRAGCPALHKWEQIRTAR
jgi:excisionase family DNA binding protein